jgi:hypothetical protein
LTNTKFELKPQEKEELNQLGKFLQANLEKRCPAELLRQQGCAGIEY